MRRADRLFALIELIRGRRLSTAANLAERLAISVRTVYRDVADLQAQGVPIEGEAGVGYRMRAGYSLPPLMFTPAEAQALAVAVRLSQPRLDTELADQAEAALHKLLAVMPASTRAAAQSVKLFAPPLGRDDATLARLGPLRAAADQRHPVRLAYLDLQERSSERLVHPLGCFFWGQVWTLAAWCTQRQAFRSFRIDRIGALTVLSEQRFDDAPGQRLADYFRAQGQPADGPPTRRAKVQAAAKTT
ncbi:MAG: hypothetical protein RJA98_801 [Pseudomonadota bacterium]|jgi:predicted DNA-binding transcriptional regulator YafY